MGVMEQLLNKWDFDQRNIYGNTFNTEKYT